MPHNACLATLPSCIHDVDVLQLEDGTISAFELPSMNHACNRIKAEGSQGMCFCPTKPWISYWIPEHENNPARLVLQEIPSKNEVKAKVPCLYTCTAGRNLADTCRCNQALYNVSKCSFYWQTTGEYLAVQVDRVSKTGKTTYTNFELFR